jgi:integrase
VPRLFHTPPKYRLHKSTRQAIVEFGGSRLYLGPYGSAKSHRRYQEALEHWRRARHADPADAPVEDPDAALLAAVTPESLRQKWKQGLRVSLNELILVYTRHARNYYRKHGVVTREAELVIEVTKLLGLKHGDGPVEGFGPVELDNFRDGLITDKDWSRKYLNKQINRVVAMFKWASKKEICAAAVYTQLAALGGLKKGRTAARETTGVTCVEDPCIQQTLPGLPEIVADMVRFQRLTGARPGEVCSLRPGDIDRTGEVWVYTPDAHKTEHHEKDRSVYIGPQAQRVLAPYLLRKADRYCFSPAESVARSRQRQQSGRTTPRSCGNRAGTNRVAAPLKKAADRYQVASYRLAIRRACQKQGVTVWTPNQLRHTAATSIRKHYGLEAAQVICGHETADVTQVYAERDRQLATRVAREVG